MLNEMVDLHEALAGIGCEFGSSHPFFRKCPKGKAAFTLSLDENGKVQDMSPPEFNVEDVYRWQEDNQKPTFPAFNVRSLLEIPEPIPEFSEDNREGINTLVEDLRNPRKKTVRAVSERALMELEERCNDLWDDKDMAWLAKCLKDTPEAMRPMLGEIPRSCKPFEELMNRAKLCNALELRNNVRSILRNKLLATGEKAYAEALFAIRNEQRKNRRGKEHQKDYLYLLVVDDWGKYPPDPEIERYPVHHRVIQSWLKGQLELFFKAQHPSTGELDAYGLDLVGADDNFAPVDVGGIGRVVPFAANNAIPCLKRYGLEGTKLFPAGLELRLNTAKAMGYALDPQRLDGTSWKSITKYEPGRTKRKTIAFAYCTALKDANALQFFDRDDEDDTAQDVYGSEIATKEALSAFDGVANEKSDAKIVFNLLSAVDPGNTKILASHKYTLSQLSDSALHWQAANENIPPVALPRITIKGKKTGNVKRTTRDAIAVYPLEVVKLLNGDWDQNGAMRSQSKRFASNEALDFLFEGDRALFVQVEKALSLLLEKGARVLISAALKARHDYGETGKKAAFKDERYVHMLPSLFGLLLYKMGIMKEDYMNEALFYLGRYFAVVDDLYIQYHKNVRSGDVPMSLLGNDHMALALENPLEAFLSMSKRLTHPYYSWAKRVSTEEKTGQIAKSCINRIAELTEELSNMHIPSVISDADKAKLLLGYLSYGPKRSMHAGSKDQITNEGETL